MRRELITVATLATLALEAPATGGGGGTIEDRAFGASQVVHGRVISARPERFRNQYGDETTITRARIRVHETLKGNPAESVEMILDKSPAFGVGEDLVVFLQETPDGLIPRGGIAGIIRLVGHSGRARNSALTVESIRERVKRVN